MSSDKQNNLIADARLTTTNISDSLDKFGYRSQVLVRRLVGLQPDQRIFGRARTVQFESTDEIDPAKPYDDMINFIDSIAGAEIVVIATGESNLSAVWGELFSAAAKARGALGMITDGNIRDSEKITEVNFPVFSIGRRPIDYRGRMVVTGSQIPVLVEGVWISPGDLLMADNDGVVVIPSEIEESVLKAARERVMTESTVLQELKAGSTLRQVWERNRVL